MNILLGAPGVHMYPWQSLTLVHLQCLNECILPNANGFTPNIQRMYGSPDLILWVWLNNRSWYIVEVWACFAWSCPEWTEDTIVHGTITWNSSTSNALYLLQHFCMVKIFPKQFITIHALMWVLQIM